MSNASSPSGNKSPEILLPDYIEDLRQKNKLTAGDFAGEKLEELAAEFVKTLSDDSKVKLNIDKVTRKVGISLVDDDNHVRYASACETVLKDKGEVVTLVVNKPLDGKYMFRVSDKGPPIVLASTVKAVEKKNGFKALNEAALITPVWKNLSDQPDFGITYFYDHGVPLVGFQPKAVSDPLQPAPFVWQLTQYCAYDPDKPDEVGEERFIFTGNSKDSKKKHSLQGYYMRLEDLRRRVETDNANTAWEDMERFKKNQPLYDLWYPDGKLVPVDRARVAFNPLEPKGSNSGDKIFQAKNLFLSHCQIARLARVNEGLYDVLSRFWDGPWETSFILQIDPKYKDQIRKSAKAIATDEDIKNLDVNPKWEKEDIPMMALIENIKTERQFQPKLSILWSTGDIDQPNPSVISLDKWASHPNSLYSLWVDSKDHLDIMHKTKLPVWLPFRDGPSSDDLKASDKNFQDLLKSKGTYKDVKTAATTMTQVTKTSIVAYSC